MDGEFEITYGYDMHCKSWCIIVYDPNGFEAESDYLGTKEGCQIRIGQLKEKYETDKVRKLKAY